MIGELIKEYLVGLGVEIDKPGFEELKSTIDRASSAISSSTTGWAKNFTTASITIATAAAGINASIAGIMTAAAKQDLAIEKYARQMMVSKGAALEMRTAVDALGESMADIQIMPELYARYKSLVGDGRQMKVGGDYDAAMKGFRDLMFEFTRLKQEASYALQWVGHYLMKYLSKPLAEAKASFKTFNDNLIKSMPMWTEKLARALVYIINIGKHFWDLLKSIGKTIYDIWDAFPRGIKIATAALTAFFLILRALPLGRMIALMSSLLLLVDDYFGYMEGKQAAMGSIWDKLNKYIDIAKHTLQEWGRVLAPIWEAFVEYLLKARDGAIEFGSNFMKWIDKIGKSKNFRDFLDTVKRLGSALDKLGSGVIEFIRKSFEELFESLRKDKAAQKFTDLMQTLWDIFLGLVDVLSEACDTLGDWFDEMARSESLRNLIDATVELFDALMDLIGAFLELCGSVLGEFFEGIGKTEPVFSFKDAIEAIVGMITAMIRALSKSIKMLAELFAMMKDNRVFKAFWKGLGEVAGEFFRIVMKALGAVGRLGQALMALVRGDWKGAKRLAGDAIDMLFGTSKAEASGRRGKGFAGTGDAQRDAIIMEASKKYGVPAHKIAGMIEAESTFKPNEASEAGAMGYMQLMPDTFEWMGFDSNDILDPYKNIMAGTKYMAYLRDYYNGDWDKVYGSYNCGPGNFDAYLSGDIPLPEESRNHIEKVNKFEKKYISNDAPYTIQDGVEDKDLNGIDDKLLSAFDDFAWDAKSKGHSIEVTSGWRSEENNARVGGVTNSKHRGKGDIGTGEAIDFIIKGDFDQGAIENLAKLHGMKVLYHDVGSGLHFHVQVDPDAPAVEFINPPERMHDPTLWDRTREGVGELGIDIQDFGGWILDGLSDFGQSIRGISTNNNMNYSTHIQNAVTRLDPAVINNLMGQGTGAYPTNYNAGNTTNVTYQVDVGGVNVQNTNATPIEIGQAVGRETIKSIEERGLYIWQNSSLNGDPSWA